MIWIFLVVTLILSLAALLVVILWSLSIYGSGAPFVPVPKKAIPGIVDALALTKTSVVYDMGCGDARILVALQKKIPSVRAIGIERALFPYLLAKVATRNTQVELLRKNFFEVSLVPATHVVLYLFPELMRVVEQKLQAELRPGAQVLAIDFSFPGRVPDHVMTLDIPGIERGKKLSIYTF